MAHMTHQQLIDQLGAELAIIGAGLVLGALAGVALFALDSRREAAAQWPH